MATAPLHTQRFGALPLSTKCCFLGPQGPKQYGSLGANNDHRACSTAGCGADRGQSQESCSVAWLKINSVLGGGGIGVQYWLGGGPMVQPMQQPFYRSLNRV